MDRDDASVAASMLLALMWPLRCFERTGSSSMSLRTFLSMWRDIAGPRDPN